MRNRQTLSILLVALSFTINIIKAQPISFSKIYDFDVSSVLYSVQQTSDSGYIASGSININSGDAYLLKLNKVGDTIWTKSYGSPYTDCASDIIITTDGGYIVAGKINHQINMDNYRMYGDIWILKLDINGDTLWTRTYGGSLNDYAKSIIQTLDGGYMVAGTKNNGGINSLGDAWILKLDQFGDTLWTKSFHFSNYLSEANSIIQTPDENIYFTGSSSIGSLEEASIFVVKLNNQGDSIWCKKLDGYMGNDIIQTGNNIVVVGRSNINDKMYKLDSNGNVIWQIDHAPNQGYYFQTNSVAIDEFGDFISVGQRINTNDVQNCPDDLWLKKNQSTGSEDWNYYLDLSSHDIANSIESTCDNGFIVAGVTNKRAWLLKLDQNCKLSNNTSEITDNRFNSWNYPNPFSSSTTIFYSIPNSNNKELKIEIFDNLGNLVKSVIQIDPNENKLLFESEDLSSGIYFYKISCANVSIFNKMLKIN